MLEQTNVVYKLFSVYDTKAQAYLNPMVMRSAGEAIRAFSAACVDPEHDFHKYCEDYTLFEIGLWDQNTCAISSYPTPQSLCKAIECSPRHRDFYFAAREKVA